MTQADGIVASMITVLSIADINVFYTTEMCWKPCSPSSPFIFQWAHIGSHKCMNPLLLLLRLGGWMLSTSITDKHQPLHSMDDVLFAETPMAVNKVNISFLKLIHKAALYRELIHTDAWRNKYMLVFKRGQRYKKHICITRCFALHYIIRWGGINTRYQTRTCLQLLNRALWPPDTPVALSRGLEPKSHVSDEYMTLWSCCRAQLKTTSSP